MNMVMNNDGHGNIASFNSLEFGIPRFMAASDDMKEFQKRSGGGHGQFDYVFTNPPFGAKIPVEDPEILKEFSLGHAWTKEGRTWVKGSPRKRMPPEILFIEACWKFLKPGSGVMSIVLPNGILGNPGEQVEFVRWWILRHTEILASVDLPAEAFLPQVSVQASCVFMRRRAENEYRLVGPDGPSQRPVFMAIAEACGHGRRGETTWVRNPDGTDLLETEEFVERWEKNGEIVSEKRRRQVRRLADDLPWIVSQYKRLVPQGGGGRR
jgi:type I restriction enzyme M protein